MMVKAANDSLLMALDNFKAENIGFLEDWRIMELLQVNIAMATKQFKVCFEVLEIFIVLGATIIIKAKRIIASDSTVDRLTIASKDPLAVSFHIINS